ncbi:DUF4412 domain-containing protein [Ancylomarina longa]|uniref:DUF4412 domain-containing protein n=1 Tax=Ancylomarina longa TaxID=2487017 RepID=A0A434AFM3_9BACT|nr:DUF4412 domain-containing protein [Ancylomarina longa]RUT73174.1 DUF4412 domain-containing protein [Ancylomarina longa]
MKKDNRVIAYLFLIILGLLGIWILNPFQNDLVVKIRIHKNGEEIRNVFYLKDNKLKVVSESKTIVFKKEQMALLDRNHKIYWEGSLNDFDQNLAKYRSRFNNSDEKTKESKPSQEEICSIKITPDFISIAGYVSRKYELIKNKKVVEDVWIAENLKNYIRYNLDLNLYNDFMDELLQHSESPMHEHLDLFMDAVENGFPMKIRTYGEGSTTESEVLNLIKKNLDDSIFVVPNTYREVSFDQAMN